jgi:hypothetical protein
MQTEIPDRHPRAAGPRDGHAARLSIGMSAGHVHRQTRTSGLGDGSGHGDERPLSRRVRNRRYAGLSGRATRTELSTVLGASAARSATQASPAGAVTRGGRVDLSALLQADPAATRRVLETPMEQAGAVHAWYPKRSDRWSARRLATLLRLSSIRLGPGPGVLADNRQLLRGSALRISSDAAPPSPRAERL